MLRNPSASLLILLTLYGVSAEAQVLELPIPAVPGASGGVLPPLAPAGAALHGVRTHWLIRTPLILAATVGGFHYAQSRGDDGPDELRTPILAGAAAGAVAGMLLSDGNPFRVILGSAMATLPAGAIAIFVAESMEDDEQRSFPLVAFTVPHGLLTSGFAQNRRLP